MFTRKACFIFVLLSAMALTGCNLRTVMDAQGEAVDMSVEATVQAMLAQAPADEGDSNVVVADQQETVSVVVTEEPGVVVTEAPAVEAACTNIVVFVADLTIPDDTVIDPGSMFVKSWRLRNGGTCTWTSAYTLVFSHGDLMGAANMLPIPGMVVPGQTVDLAVNLTAPVAPGTYQGYWKMRSDTGLLFGLGGTNGFWVRIVVPEPEVAPEPEAEPEPVEEDPFIFEGVFELQPMFFIFTSSGTNQTLLDNQCFDLDTGVIAGCANPIADFVYDVSFFFPSFKYYIRPRNGASFGYYGFEQPTGTDCQGHALDGSKQVIKSGYFCYQTTDGKYGYLKASGSSMVSTNFNWATYTFP